MKTLLTSFVFLFLLVACDPIPKPPQADLIITPSSGTIKTIFDLDASLTVDPDGLQQLLESRWDFDGDGTYDTEFAKGLITAVRYKSTGQYHPVVEVRDAQGLTSTATATIDVNDISTFTDSRNGKKYPMVRFGKLWWMAQNLDYGKLIGPEQSQTNNGIAEKYRYPGDDPDSLFGGLYQWGEAMGYSHTEGVQGICPAGWRLPTESDWKNLMSFFVDPLQPRPSPYWISGCKYVPDQWVQHNNYYASGAIFKLLKSTGGTGFDAIMVGYRNPDGNFGDQDYYFPGKTASFWTSSTDGIYAIRNRFYVTEDNQGEVFSFADNKQFAFSIRCVKNAQ